VVVPLPYAIVFPKTVLSPLQEPIADGNGWELQRLCRFPGGLVIRPNIGLVDIVGFAPKCAKPHEDLAIEVS
jgi:hypothetical protein